MAISIVIDTDDSQTNYSFGKLDSMIGMGRGSRDTSRLSFNGKGFFDGALVMLHVERMLLSGSLRRRAAT